MDANCGGVVDWKAMMNDELKSKILHFRIHHSSFILVSWGDIRENAARSFNSFLSVRVDAGGL
jgi:hypothetical protein